MGLFNNWPYVDEHKLNLDWVIKTVKQAVTEWTKYHEDMDAWQEELNTNFTNLKSFVEDYFENLDVDEEIRAKLDDMAASGELSDLITPLLPTLVPSTVIEWLDNNITPTTPIVDKSLMISGAAADSKIVGDYVLPACNGNVDLGAFIENSYVTTQGVITPYDGWHRTDYIEIDPTKLLYITKIGAGSAGNFNCLYDANKNFIVAFPLSAGLNERPLPPATKYMILSDQNTIEYRVNTLDNIYNDRIVENLTDDNILPMYGWYCGIVDANGHYTQNYKRLTSGKIPVIGGATLVYDLSPTYQIYFQTFNSNDVRLQESLYDDNEFELDKDAAYMYITMMRRDDDWIYQDQLPDCDIKLMYKTEAYNSNAITVTTFNVGGYAYGIGYGIPPADYPTKSANYRNYLGDKYADIMGLQEFSTVIQVDPEIRSEPALWDKYYPYKYRTGSQTAIFSRWPLNNGGFHTMETSPDRYYVDAYTYIDNKLVYLLSVHLTPTEGSAGLNKRLAEMREVKDLLAGHEYSICFGDFNAWPGEENSIYSILTNEGYKMANTGDMGSFWSWSTNRDDFNHYDDPTGTVFYIDNIFVSSNIDILHVEADNTYNALTSDHIPITAKIALK